MAETREPVEAGTRYCYRHPDRETGLSCSECGRPICYECMTPAPVGLRCPEHSGKPQGVRKVTSAASRVATGQASRSGYPITIALLAINIGVYLLELALGGTVDGLANAVYYKGVLFAHGYVDTHGNGAFQPFPGGSPGVADGGWWRLLTAAFLHYGPIHLAFNMLALYWFGRVLESVIGSWRYLLLYVGSGLCGSAGALWLSPNSLTVGASGAIFGVLGALLVLERRGAIATGGQVLGLIVLNLVITFALAGISIGGHIGGLIGGIALMVLFLRFRRSTALSLVSALAVSGIAVAVAYAVI